MATLVWLDATVSIDSNDLSDHVRQVTLNLGAETPDDTAMGDDTRSAIAGLLTWSLDVDFYQDFAADKVDVVLEALLGGAAFPIIVAPVSGGESATNPSYTGQAVLSSYGAVEGTVGDMAIARASFVSAGTLDRDVTP